VRIDRGLGGWQFAAPETFIWPGAKYAVAADIDDDGDLDIYVSAANKVGTPNPPDLLLRNGGNGTFTSETVSASSTEGVGGRVTALDHDCDGASSILLVNSDDVEPLAYGPLQLMSDTAPRAVNRLVNGGFECDLAAWQGSGVGLATTSEVHRGSKAAVFSASSGFTSYRRQSVAGLPPGIYNASVWYKRIGTIKWMNLEVRVSNPATRTTSYLAKVTMKRRDAWESAALSNIPVNTGDVVQYRIGMNVNADGTVFLDDLRLQ
jgi:hypothetical protein